VEKKREFSGMFMRSHTDVAAGNGFADGVQVKQDISYIPAPEQPRFFQRITSCCGYFIQTFIQFQ
jgi:hypothetical protein